MGGVVGILSVPPLEKTAFPFPGMYQPQIASWLVLGSCAHVPFLCRDVWFEPGQELCTLLQSL